MFLLQKGLLFFLFFAFTFSLFPRLLAAQLPTGVSQQKIQVSASPSAPGAYREVTLTAESFLTDLNRAVITWTVNGKQVERGVGKTVIKVKTGATGSVLSVRASASTADQGDISASLSLVAASVTLLLEGDTYAPPLYKGRPLYTAGAEVRVVAIPQIIRGGALVPASELIYTWKKDGKIIPEASGYGKSSYKASPGFLTRPIKIEAEVSTVDQSVIGRSAVELATKLPLVVMYEKDPALGLIIERALETSYQLKNKEMTVAAIPYFFSAAATRDSTLSYVWKMNGEVISNQSGDPSTLTLRQSGEEVGQGLIAVEVSHGNQILQTARNTFSIFFGRSATPLLP